MARYQKGEETRTRILQAAEECFARRGYDATGVAEICRRAGLSKGAFYHHFASKQALFLELLNRWLGTLDEQLEAINTGAADASEGLMRMAAVARQAFVDARGRLALFLEFWNQAQHDPEVWKATIAPYRRYREFFSRMVAAGIAEGTLREVDPDLAARVIVSFAVGLLLQGVLDPQEADWGEVAHEGIKIILQGLEAGQRC